ncbi:MAG: glycosyltransferase [Lachnospiraceae bacterium]|nr:glycosyltransferase [Lachnospiraceae bacterium]
MNTGLERAFEKLGLVIDVVPAVRTDGREWDETLELAERLHGKLQAGTYDAAFSLNFNPQVSRACEEAGVPYISWINDSPFYIGDEAAVRRANNRICIFDRGYLEEYRAKGYPAFHVPLAVDTEFFTMAAAKQKRADYETDIAMVGSLYNSEYEQITRPLTEKTKKLLEQILETQAKIREKSVLPQLFTEAFLTELNRQYLEAGIDFTVDGPGLEYLMLKEITGRDRKLIPSLLVKKHRVRVYTGDTMPLPGVDMRGPVDYETQMPAVFSYSRININVTLRTIRTGIPLRVLDILGSGGFLITDPQEEILEHFTPGRELEIYRSLEELYEKTDWYLAHEEERQSVARTGLEKVKRDFTFDAAIRRMLEEI